MGLIRWCHFVANQFVYRLCACFPRTTWYFDPVDDIIFFIGQNVKIEKWQLARAVFLSFHYILSHHIQSVLVWSSVVSNLYKIIAVETDTVSKWRQAYRKFRMLKRNINGRAQPGDRSLLTQLGRRVVIRFWIFNRIYIRCWKVI